MDALEKTTARKNTKISFRTDDVTLTKLKTVCRIENKTISSLIEDVLTEYVLCQENPLTSQGEKRQSPRKQCSIPAVIFSVQQGTTHYRNCTIVNISSSSMQIILKRLPQTDIPEHSFDILFSLPNHEHPMLFSCEFIRASHIHDESMIVAGFVCPDEPEKSILEQYLLTSQLGTDALPKSKHR